MELNVEADWDSKPEDTETTRWLWNPLAEGGAKWVEVTLQEIEEGIRIAEEMQRKYAPVIEELETPSDIVS